MHTEEYGEGDYKDRQQCLYNSLFLHVIRNKTGDYVPDNPEILTDPRDIYEVVLYDRGEYYAQKYREHKPSSAIDDEEIL